LKLVSIVVTYQSAGTIERCLRSLEESTKHTEIIVVDNASSDDTVKVISAKFPDVHLIQSTTNLGFAAGCDLGFAQPISMQAEAIFLCNPDVVVESTCLEFLLQALSQDKGFGAVSPLTIQEESGEILYAGARFDIKHLDFSFIGWGEVDEGQYRETVATGMPTGGSMMISADALQRVGTLDPKTFLFWEELEWTIRAYAAGYKIGFVAGARASHAFGHSTGGTHSALTTYYFTRNQLRFFTEVSGRSRLNVSLIVLFRSLRSLVEVYSTLGLVRSWRVAKATAFAFLDFWRGRQGKSTRY
jgi:GT2 family glycosyltransferase